jgi:hypothetical protein
MKIQKDEVLDQLATRGNVAQFVAYRPGPSGLRQSFSRLAGHAPNSAFDSLRDAAATLILLSGEGAVNVRSYVPHDPRSREFVYGLRTVDDVIATANRLASEGLHIILNETVDIHDGGVSGVAQGGLVEFAPDDTPRCVEKPGVASLPFEIAMKLLEQVYGFRPDVHSAPGERSNSVSILHRAGGAKVTLCFGSTKRNFPTRGGPRCSGLTASAASWATRLTGC